MTFSMMANRKTKYDWVLETISYDSVESLIVKLIAELVDPIIEKRAELRRIKASMPTIISGKDLRKKSKQGKP